MGDGRIKTKEYRLFLLRKQLALLELNIKLAESVLNVLSEVMKLPVDDYRKRSMLQLTKDMIVSNFIFQMSVIQSVPFVGKRYEDD